MSDTTQYEKILNEPGATITLEEPMFLRADELRQREKHAKESLRRTVDAVYAAYRDDMKETARAWDEIWNVLAERHGLDMRNHIYKLGFLDGRFFVMYDAPRGQE